MASGAGPTDRQRLDLPGFASIGLFGLLFAVLSLAGGASRNNEPQQIAVWWVSILVVAGCLALGDAATFRRVRAPLIFWGLCLACLIAQVVPLPPAIWTQLPGRAFYMESATLAGIDQPWRPLTLTPVPTYFSILGMLPPLAVILGYALLDKRALRFSFMAALGVIALAVLFGTTQAAAGKDDLLRLYAVSNPGAAVGIFANRNHQGLLLAASLPLLAVWPGLSAQRSTTDFTYRQYCAAFMLLPIMLLILVTGSRGGLISSGLGLAGFLVLYQNLTHLRVAGRRISVKWLMIGALPVLAIASGVLFARSEALRRLIEEGLTGQQRSGVIAPGLEMVREFFPVGSGSASFATVYQRFEPFDTLRVTYANQTHNDPLQLLIEWSVPGALLALLFLAWFGLRAVRLARLPRTARREPAVRAAAAGAVVIVMALVFSFHDYPLRTPLWASLFTLAALWLNDATRSDARPAATGRGGHRPEPA